MKTRTILLAVAALALCPSCTSPFGQNDTFRASQGVAMQGQMAAHQQASLAMAGTQARAMRSLAPMQTGPVRPIQPLNAYAR